MAVQISGNDITVPRDGTFSRNVSIAGTLTYEDVTNVDSIGLVTARNGIEVGASPGVAASISVDGNAIFSGITTVATLRATTGIVTAFQGDIVIEDKIIHSGDTDTAIRFPSADTITAETGGTERLRITSDGKYQFPGTGGGSGARGLEIDTESIGAADEGVILNARASGNTGQIKLQTNSATAVTVEGNGGNVNLASNLKVAGVCTATSFSGSGANLTGISGGLFSSYAVITDEKANGTDGGSFDSGAWRMRDLNTEKFDPDGIVSVSSNEFSLGTGTYYIEVFAPAYGVARHMAKIYSVSSPSQDWYGENAFAHGSHYATTHSFVRARITCSGTRNLAIAHRCETSRSTSGFGVACGFGNVETYTVVKIYKES